MNVGIYSPGYTSGLVSTILKARKEGLSFLKITTPKELFKTKTEVMIIDPTPEMDFGRIRKYIKTNPKTSFLINGTLNWEVMKEELNGFNNVKYLKLSEAPGKILEILRR